MEACKKEDIKAEEQTEEARQFPSMQVDMSKQVWMSPVNQKIPVQVPGCNNFSNVTGYKIYCCDQQTIAGFQEALIFKCLDCGTNFK